MELKKKTHIEISNGDTLIASYKGCPLQIEEIQKEGNYIPMKNKSVPYCKCAAYINDIYYDKCCRHFNGLVYSKKDGLKVDCIYKKQ